jgi:ATP:ADP antiporter, AAA family
MMMFWIVFVFTMTRDTKDALIVTNCGAEAIAFLKVRHALNDNMSITSLIMLKVYGVIPAATGFMVLYAKLSNILPMQTLFYVILAPFFVFYTLFAFVLYPLRHYLHPLSLAVPQGGMAYAVNLLRYW